MKDQIHLNKANLRGVPVGQLQRDGFIDQGRLSGIMGPIITPLALIGLKESVNGGGTDGFKPQGRLPGDLKVTSPYQGVDLGPKQGRKSLPTGVIEQFPQPQQDAMDLSAIASTSLLTDQRWLKQQCIDLSNSIFSVLARISTILIENPSLFFSRSLGIGPYQDPQILSAGAHVHPFHVTLQT